MQLQLNVNDFKASIFLELLDVFKKDNLINDYKIVDNYNKFEEDILNDLQDFKTTLNNAKHGNGKKIDKFVNI